MTESTKELGRELSTALRCKADEIIEAWVGEVHKSIGGGYEAGLTYEGIRSRLPQILEVIAVHLSSASDDEQNVEKSNCKKEFIPLNAQVDIPIRVELGFDIDEMLRELSILRALVMTALSANFSTADLSSTLLASTNVDAVLNRIISHSTKRHAQYQLARIELKPTELLSSNQELVRLIQMQKDNAAHLAHELKNPIHAVVTLSSLLLRDKQKASSELPESVREIGQIERIYDNGNRLSALVSNMLEVSRKESYELALKTEPVCVLELVSKVVDSMTSEALKKGIALVKDCTQAPPQVIIDSLRLQQILVNLVSNAIRYTDEGSVKVRCYCIDEERWALSVCDTGRGIHISHQKRIFSPYVRAGEASAHSAESSGLGLTIVSKLIELLQGELSLVSELGEGSTFSVTLPIDAQQLKSKISTI